MVEKREIYYCEKCGNLIEVLHNNSNSLVCCGQPMKLLQEKTLEEGQEKHVPVIEENEEGVKVKVGSIEHPMEENHYIEWIEISTDKGESKKFLHPGEKPKVLFPVKTKITNARIYCNIHGLWKNKD